MINCLLVGEVGEGGGGTKGRTRRSCTHVDLLLREFQWC